MILGVAFRVTTPPALPRRPSTADGQAANPRRRRPADSGTRDHASGQQRSGASSRPQPMEFIDGADLPAGARAAAAARAFAAGNGYLTGLIVDRFA